jgi:DNA-binding SARP family transcriptional activator/ABC-type branched-subunit amino acid transport system substrate-binding protein/sugar lactone lactonase YvrE
VQFLVLGPLEVRDGENVVPLGGTKQRATLAMLLLHRNTVVSRDRLIDGLWGDSPPATAAHTLEAYISRLRKAFRLADDPDRLRMRPPGYLLRVDDGELDLERFESLMDRGRSALGAGDAGTAAAAFRGALALFRGGPLEDLTYMPFAQVEVPRLEDMRVAALEQRIEADMAAGRNADLIGELQVLVSRYPLRERFWAQLMLSEYRAGRQADALATFDVARSRLVQEVGIEPGLSLRQLHTGILRQDPALEQGAVVVAAPSDPANVEAPAAVGADMRRLARGRRRPMPFVVAGALLVLAVVAAALAVSQSGGGAVARVAGNSLAEIDPATGRVVAQYPVGATPTSVVAGDGTVWTVNADEQTISRLDLADRTVRSQGLGVTPTDMTLADGRLWVTYLREPSPGARAIVGVLQLDPSTMRQVGVTDMPGTPSPHDIGPVIASGPAGIWVAGPVGSVERLDPSTGRVAAQLHLADASDPSEPLLFTSIAVGRGEVWVTGFGMADLQSHLIGIDASSNREEQRINQGAGNAIAIVGHELWVADSGSGLVWRVDPGPPVHIESVRAGLSASDIAVADGTVWVPSAVDGTLVGISPATERVRRIAIGSAPQGVAAADHRLWVSVAHGGGGSIPASASNLGIATLPGDTCGKAVYGGPGRPQLLIASDFPFDQYDTPRTRAMSQAIVYVLRTHHFMAGSYRVAYQSCDDATPQTGSFDEGKCAANAKAMVATSSVIGVVGTYNSGCAAVELPITNRAHPGPLAMISPTNTIVGLTHSGPGVAAVEPNQYYPTGIRNYARVALDDDTEVVGDAIWAERLGLRRVYVFQDGADYPAAMQAPTFAAAARRRGIQVIGPQAPQMTEKGYRALGASLRARHVDGIFIAGNGDHSEDFIRGIRGSMGASVTLIASDLFADGQDRGAAAVGMYIGGFYLTNPARQLPTIGQRFMHRFSATQPRGLDDGWVPYAAQAAEVLLAGIARSDGTRASVTSQLLHTRVKDGILGTFGFDRNGDPTASLVTICRLTRDPRSADQNVVALVRVARR